MRLWYTSQVSLGIGEKSQFCRTYGEFASRQNAKWEWICTRQWSKGTKSMKNLASFGVKIGQCSLKLLRLSDATCLGATMSKVRGNNKGSEGMRRLIMLLRFCIMAVTGMGMVWERSEVPRRSTRQRWEKEAVRKEWRWSTKLFLMQERRSRRRKLQRVKWNTGRGGMEVVRWQEERDEEIKDNTEESELDKRKEMRAHNRRMKGEEYWRIAIEGGMLWRLEVCQEHWERKRRTRKFQGRMIIREEMKRTTLTEKKEDTRRFREKVRDWRLRMVGEEEVGTIFNLG